MVSSISSLSNKKDHMTRKPTPIRAFEGIITVDYGNSVYVSWKQTVKSQNEDHLAFGRDHDKRVFTKNDQEQLHIGSAVCWNVVHEFNLHTQSINEVSYFSVKPTSQA